MTPAPARFSSLRRAGALILALALICVAGLTPATSARAQGLFSAALYVNDEPITNYDIDQKMRFLRFLGATNANPRQQAIEHLIEDRLQAQEGRRLGGRLTPDQLDAGIAEFAGRANLTADQLISRMQAAGIDRETLVDFISSGVIWRELIRARFGSRVTITDAQIDQALSVAGLQPVTEVQISEIFLPTDPQFAQQVQVLIPQIQRIRSETEFSNAARQVSAAPSGPQGGRVNRWISIASMPPEVGSVMENAAIGTVVGPFDVPGAVAFFQLRARRTARSVPPDAIEVVYDQALLPGGRSEANLAAVAQVRESVDSCVDFDAAILRALPDLPASAVTQQTHPQSALPSGTRTELERLNPGQISANQVQDGALVVQMLCARRVGASAAPSRDTVRAQLMNRALEGESALYLQRLRAQADIRQP